VLIYFRDLGLTVYLRPQVSDDGLAETGRLVCRPVIRPMSLSRPVHNGSKAWLNGSLENSLYSEIEFFF
jgi:hypothetical protein